MYPCVESTIDIVVDDFNVRLWINRREIPETLEEEQKLAQTIFKFTGHSMQGLIKKIINLVPNLNAVQVRNGAVGCVVYTVDFGDKDPHG